MVLGHETPEAGVGRVVAVVAHHEIIVHGECIGVGRLSVDIYRVVFQIRVGMTFIIAYDTLVYRPCRGIQMY